MKIPLFLKPYAAWATGLTDKYRSNPFVRTSTHIIVLQLVLAILIALFFGWGIVYVQDQTVGAIRDNLTAISHGNQTALKELPAAIERVRTRTFELVFVGMILLNTLFGFLLARFALRPTKHSLQFQKRFIGNVAHEIRTPLAIMKTNTEVALFDPKLSKPVKEVLEDSIIELDRISETINNLLSFDTLIRPQRVKTELVELGVVVETVVKRHHALAHTRGIELSRRIGTHRKIQGNATALDQVITNLVKNALNYTPQNKGGSVHVDVDLDYQGAVVLTVADTGIGIDQKDLFHIFEPFYRADTSRARGIGTGSSGLGLAIVNEIVRLHRATINVRSAIGKGTAIKVTFPRVRDSEQPKKPLAEGGSSLHEVSLDFNE